MESRYVKKSLQDILVFLCFVCFDSLRPSQHF